MSLLARSDYRVVDILIGIHVALYWPEFIFNRTMGKDVDDTIKWNYFPFVLMTSVFGAKLYFLCMTSGLKMNFSNQEFRVVRMN